MPVNTFGEPLKSYVENGLITSLKLLLVHDSYLLEKDLNERTITHRLAIHLQSKFSDWNVDCEYNRDHDGIKQVIIHKDESVSIRDTDAKNVFPDIIIHHRGTGNNLVALEVKKSGQQQVDWDWDKEKLCEYKKELGYQYVYFLKIRTGKVFGVESLEGLSNDDGWEKVPL